MILAFNQLQQLIDDGVIDALPENVNAASIDIRIGDEIMMEDTVRPDQVIIDLDKKQSPNLKKVKIGEEGIVIPPGAFFLATSIETFDLPDTISAEFKLRSSVARSGLQHMLAGWCDAGWHGSQLTMEFKNELRNHSMLIKPGMRIGQMVFFEHESAKEGSYAIKGRYNNQIGVQESKGIS
ncbi:dCTP deaminase [Vibrio owensii]|uniref:dCTP deaminase n=1 Tax=Vibrio owensii TaxID=696485 RepID=UPI00339B1988